MESSNRLIMNIKNIGLISFILTTKSGISILERIYDTNLALNKKDIQLITAFILKISTYSDYVNEPSLIRDIGLHTLRLFIDESDDFIYLLFFNEIGLDSKMTKEAQKIIKRTTSSVKSYLDIILSDLIIENNLSLNEIQVQNKIFPFITHIDLILFESYNEIKNMTEEITSGLSYINSFDMMFSYPVILNESY